MKNILKDFLFFNQKDKNAIILLLVVIGIMGLYSIYLNSFSKLDPSYYILQQQIEEEFKTYEDNLDNREVISIYSVENQDIDTKTSNNEKKTSNKTKLTKGQIINLNNADFDALMRIPGIGKTLAQRIIEYRIQIGTFASIEQLLVVKGITTTKLKQIIPFVTIK